MRAMDQIYRQESWSTLAGVRNGPQPQGCTKQTFHQIALNRSIHAVRGRVNKRLSITGRFALLYERVCVYTGCVKVG